MVVLSVYVVSCNKEKEQIFYANFNNEHHCGRISVCEWFFKYPQMGFNTNIRETSAIMKHIHFLTARLVTVVEITLPNIFPQFKF